MSNKVKLDIWVKPDGVELPVNREPASVEKAKELGWKKKK